MLPHKPRYFSYVIPFTCRPTWRMQMLSRRRSDAGHQFRRRCVQMTRRFPRAPSKYFAARAIRVSNPESSDGRGYFPGNRAIYGLLIKYQTRRRVSTISPANGAYLYMRRASARSLLLRQLLRRSLGRLSATNCPGGDAHKKRG